MDPRIRQAEAARRRRVYPRLGVLVRTILAGVARGPWIAYVLTLLIGMTLMTSAFWGSIRRQRVPRGNASPSAFAYRVISPSAVSGPVKSLFGSLTCEDYFYRSFDGN